MLRAARFVRSWSLKSSSVRRCPLLFIGIDACLVARAAAVTMVTEWPRFTVRLALSTLRVGKTPAIKNGTGTNRTRFFHPFLSMTGRALESGLFYCLYGGKLLGIRKWPRRFVWVRAEVCSPFISFLALVLI